MCIRDSIDSLLSSCPNSRLIASGEDVGLPAGQIGNSEVGHTNIGAGRIVYQDLSRISLDIKNGGFFKNPAYNGIMDAVKGRGTALHIMGLVSPGGVQDVYKRQVVHRAPVVVAAGKLLLIELNHLSGFHTLTPQLFKLLFGAVNPHNRLGLYKCPHLLYPI